MNAPYGSSRMRSPLRFQHSNSQQIPIVSLIATKEKLRAVYGLLFRNKQRIRPHATPMLTGQNSQFKLQFLLQLTLPVCIWSTTSQTKYPSERTEHRTHIVLLIIENSCSKFVSMDMKGTICCQFTFEAATAHNVAHHRDYVRRLSTENIKEEGSQMQCQSLMEPLEGRRSPYLRGTRSKTSLT
jgi:hypothetical protein